ncbi:MAG TPA: hypothetical protein VH678_33015 [Xanthobacteraceae bacterium]
MAKAAGLSQRTRCDREGEGGSGRCLGLASGCELVQSAASKAIPEGGINHPDPKPDRSSVSAGKPGCPLDGG